MPPCPRHSLIGDTQALDAFDQANKEHASAVDNMMSDLDDPVTRQIMVRYNIKASNAQ